MHLCLGSMNYRLHFETDKVLCTDFVRCDKMTSQYLMHCVLRKTLCTTSSVSVRGDLDSENQCGDPEHRITLCKIITIKTDKIDW